MAKRGVKSKYKPEYEKQALIFGEKGFTDKEIADFLGVTEQTVNNWKKSYPNFFESLKKGKAVADEKVERSLYNRATGYSHPDVHISNYQGNITITPIIKHYPPDVTAQIFWLKNRKPNEWRDKHEQVHDVSDKLADLLAKIPSTMGVLPCNE